MATATATAAQRKMFIDGKWVGSDSGRTLGVINPATEEVVAEVAYGGRAEARRAIEAAGPRPSGPSTPRPGPFRPGGRRRPTTGRRS